MKRSHSLLYTCLVSAVLTACGGDNAPAPTPLTLQGTAARGFAVSLASVSAKCSGQSTPVSTTTAVDGTYRFAFSGGVALPCILKLNDPMGNMYTLVEEGGTNVTANITPLTNMQTAVAAGTDGSILFTKFSGNFLSSTKGLRLQKAQNEIVNAFAPVVDLSGIDSFISSPLIAAVQASGGGAGQSGNSHDRKLDQILAALSKVNKQYSDVSSSLLALQGDDKVIDNTGSRVASAIFGGGTTPTNPGTPEPPVPTTPTAPPSTGGGTGTGGPTTPQTVTFSMPNGLALSPTPITVVATASSGLPVIISSTTPSICTMAGNALTTVAPGICILTAYQGGNATYMASPVVTQTVTLGKKAQNLTFPAVGDQSVQGNPPTLYASTDSGLPITIWTSTSSVCRVNGTTLTLVGSGTCTLTAEQAGNSVYAAASLSQSFNVSNTNQTINFSNPGNQTMLNTSVILTATSTSGLPVALNSTTPSVCSVSGVTATLLQPGVCTITADQAGNSAYQPAPTVTRSFNITQASQTINITIPPDITFAASTVTISITATSGLPVTTAVMTPSVCSLSGQVVTILSAGTCTLNANQPGNTFYAPATTVLRSFTITP